MRLLGVPARLGRDQEVQRTVQARPDCVRHLPALARASHGAEVCGLPVRPPPSQKLVFEPAPHGRRKVVFSTNIAETSITIPDVTVVIDGGVRKEKSYDPISGLAKLDDTFVARANALQRRGRAGRVQEGKCVHLFPRFKWSSLDPIVLPELQRTPLEEVVLFTKMLGIRDLRGTIRKALDVPQEKAIEDGVALLKKIRALEEEDEELTPLGRVLADLPCHPQLGRILLYGAFLQCLEPAALVVGLLQGKAIVVTDPAKRKLTDSTRAFFAGSAQSDHYKMLRAFTAWRAQEQSGNRTFCREKGLSLDALRTAQGAARQCEDALGKAYLLDGPRDGDSNELRDSWELVRCAVAAGLYPNVAQAKGFLWTKDRCQMVLADNRSNVQLAQVSEDKNEYVVYFEKCLQGVNEKRLQVLDASKVPPHIVPLLLAHSVDDAAAEGDSSMRRLSVDGWMCFDMQPEAASAVAQFRRTLDDALQVYCAQMDARLDRKVEDALLQCRRSMSAALVEITKGFTNAELGAPGSSLNAARAAADVGGESSRRESLSGSRSAEKRPREGANDKPDPKRFIPGYVDDKPDPKRFIPGYVAAGAPGEEASQQQQQQRQQQQLQQQPYYEEPKPQRSSPPVPDRPQTPGPRPVSVRTLSPPLNRQSTPVEGLGRRVQSVGMPNPQQTEPQLSPFVGGTPPLVPASPTTAVATLRGSVATDGSQAGVAAWRRHSAESDRPVRPSSVLEQSDPKLAVQETPVFADPNDSVDRRDASTQSVTTTAVAEHAQLLRPPSPTTPVPVPTFAAAGAPRAEAAPAPDVVLPQPRTPTLADATVSHAASAIAADAAEPPAPRAPPAAAAQSPGPEPTGERTDDGGWETQVEQALQRIALLGAAHGKEEPLRVEVAAAPEHEEGAGPPRVVSGASTAPDPPPVLIEPPSHQPRLKRRRPRANTGASQITLHLAPPGHEQPQTPRTPPITPSGPLPTLVFSGVAETEQPPAERLSPGGRMRGGSFRAPTCPPPSQAGRSPQQNPLTPAISPPPLPEVHLQADDDVVTVDASERAGSERAERTRDACGASQVLPRFVLETLRGPLEETRVVGNDDETTPTMPKAAFHALSHVSEGRDADIEFEEALKDIEQATKADFEAVNSKLEFLKGKMEATRLNWAAATPADLLQMRKGGGAAATAAWRPPDLLNGMLGQKLDAIPDFYRWGVDKFPAEPSEASPRRD
eukprot:TRINITY_DN3638_c0_g2_i5.p1 TRINITY_DN3638_c0_g2~~TRINITY_DN3638_c0_g2_i5.p1  ORF type:complete len:1214 (+),score=301.15 TRINITY_DN3638_c0_g2_i5:1893-5534(+)